MHDAPQARDRSSALRPHLGTRKLAWSDRFAGEDVMARILVVDDDGHTREVIRFALEKAGHRCVEAADGAEAIDTFVLEPIDLVVLDIVMPEEDGLEVCRRIRAKSAGARGRVPVLFLSSRADEVDRIVGLEMGGDDYLTKPFSPRELVARVKALLRRAYPEDPVGACAAPDSAPRRALRHGDLVLDPERHRCTWQGKDVRLTATEFSLVEVLLTAPGRLYSRDELIERVYGDSGTAERTLDSHVRHIRAKFREVGGDPIETVHGLGYRIAS
ncbi:MAG: response regulator transcription factor [bacterium]